MALDIYRQPTDGPVLFLQISPSVGDMEGGYTANLAFVDSTGTRTSTVALTPLTGTANVWWIAGNEAGTAPKATKIA
jgi:hypothetical protein